MIHDALYRIPEKPGFVELPAICIEFLREHTIPVDIINDLARSSLHDWVKIGNLTLMPFSEIVEEHTGIPECIANGFLALAGGANGDPVVVDRSDRKIHYVSHDLLWRRLVGDSRVYSSHTIRLR